MEEKPQFEEKYQYQKMLSDSETPSFEVIRNRLRDLCEEKNINAKTLAERSGLSERMIKRMLLAGRTNPGVFYMIKICKGLGITLDEFFKDYFPDE